MAGIPIQSSDVNIKHHDVVLGWMFDYACYRIWDQFSRNSSIPETDKDIIQGLCGILKDFENRSMEEGINQKWLFVLNICRLEDGEDIEVHYEEDSDETPLECMLNSFEKLVNFLTPALKDEGLKLIPVIKSEAVLVCCRKGAFDRAKKLISSLWKTQSLDDHQKHLTDMLKAIVRSKNPENETMSVYTYSNFLDTMKKFMGKIFELFPKPMLLEVAERKNESEKQIAEEAKNIRKRTRNERSDTLKNCMDNGGADADKVSKDRTKLRKLWNRNTKELFELDSPDAIGSRCINSMMPPPASSVLRKATTKTPSATTTVTNTQEPPSTETHAVTQTPSKGGKAVSPESPKENASGSDMRYRKNIGRANRHVPDSTNQNTNQNNRWENESMDFSMVSTSSHVKNKWTQDEMEEFFDAVQTIGVGNWSKIREYLETNRTNVMLKDKWRNMLKSGDAKRLAKRGKKK